ncbi:MAG: ribokinase [Chloroflexi bacterium]|nr:ribokinase [Chloroflexota bacterium]
MTPEFLAIGHVTIDVGPHGRHMGGAAAYAALTAARLGLQSAVLTATSMESLPELSEAGVLVERVASATTTVFENWESPGGRTQVIRSVAAGLTEASVPSAWLETPIVLLAPVAQEVSPALAHRFAHALLGITPQGWLRCWDASGRVSPAEWEAAREVLSKADAVVVSREDLRNSGIVEEWAKLVPLLVITAGAEGGRFCWRGVWHPFSAYSRPAIEPTGAGDVFAAALLVQWYQRGDPISAVAFASCAASFCVESPGLQGVPTLDQVQERMGEEQPQGGLGGP